MHYHSGVRRTIGYHIVISGYGLWLPGDDRGSWSEAWDEQIGFTEPHVLHAGDPVRLRMARERMAHPPVRLTGDMMAAVVESVHECADDSDWTIAAASIEATHSHVLLTYSLRDIDTTVKWIKDCATKAIHRRTDHDGPVWCKGRWRVFVFDESHWTNLVGYIERHNCRRGLPARPYAFIT
ncbi:MAG: transposase [Gemmatimonadetes bacterium]|nr:transposase [Gemmatimonadota bacterium]